MKRRNIRRRKKVCVFCADKTAVIDYKDANKLKRYISLREVRFFLEELPVTVQKHQRALTVAVKRARQIALLPYVVD